MKKSILFKMWTFPGACETFLIAQIITAIDCGHEVSILLESDEYLKDSRHRDLIEKYRIEEKIIFEDYAIPKNYVIKFLKISVILLINISRIFKLITFLKNRRYLELDDIYKFHFFKFLNNYDIIHVQYGTNAKPLDILKEIGVLKSKLIVSFHGHDLFFPINGRIHNNGYYKCLFENADLLVANTGYLKNLLINLGAEEKKTRTIPVAVNTEIFSPALHRCKNKKIRVITVGRLEVFKGQKFGIEVIKKLLDNNYDVHYTIVGIGSQSNDLKDLVEQYKLSKHIDILGEKSQKEVRSLLQNSDIFLMTSVTDPNYGVESQGLVTAEAQACGLPVVGFDSGGVKYTLVNNETGFLVPEVDITKMYEKIEKLVDDVSLRMKMGKNAINYIQDNFSKKMVDKKWCDIYNKF